MDMVPEESISTNNNNVGQNYLVNIDDSAVVDDTSAQLAAAAAFSSSTNFHSSKPIPPTITASINNEHKTKISITELEVYMKTWISNLENASALNLMPSSSQKNQIVLETGIEKSRLEGWLYR